VPWGGEKPKEQQKHVGNEGQLSSGARTRSTVGARPASFNDRASPKRGLLMSRERGGKHVCTRVVGRKTSEKPLKEHPGRKLRAQGGGGTHRLKAKGRRGALRSHEKAPASKLT